MNPWESATAPTATATADRDDIADGWVAPLAATGLAWRDLPARIPQARSKLIAVIDRVPDPGQPAGLPHLLLLGLREAPFPVLGWCRLGSDASEIDGIPYHAALPESAEGAPDRMARWLDDLLPVWLADNDPTALLTGVDDGLITTAAALRAAAATGTPSILRLDTRTADQLLAANLVERASWIIAADEATAQLAVDAGAPDHRVAVVPDPFDVESARAAGLPDLVDELGIDGVAIGLLIDEHTAGPLDFLAALAPLLEATPTTIILLGPPAGDNGDEIQRLAPGELRVIRSPGSSENLDVHRLGLGLAVDCRRSDDDVPDRLRVAGVPVLSLTTEDDVQSTTVDTLARQTAELAARPSRRLLEADEERTRALLERSPYVVGDRYGAVLAEITRVAVA